MSKEAPLSCVLHCQVQNPFHAVIAKVHAVEHGDQTDGPPWRRSCKWISAADKAFIEGWIMTPGRFGPCGRGSAGGVTFLVDRRFCKRRRAEYHPCRQGKTFVLLI
ncbi:unnamed protein product [Cladocopium goreaui]|uniref:Uncharacterized protein n=1 Tax=Cladocopium goreaui TaxID=2562237 RepID=A0A9P1DRM1_9DINO|nr:unnamed protein product [Cladocopium goreaui]